MKVRLAALALVAVLAAAPAGAQQGGAPLEVIVAPVRTDRFYDRVEALGTTRANESVDITTTVNERIVELRFDDGKRVEAGEVLVVLERDQEIAAVKAAEAILDERRSAYERAQRLESRQFAATAQLEERLAAMKEAEAELDIARAELAEREIRAPFAGQLGLRNVSVGTLVEPGDVIVTLSDLSVMKLDFAVPSTYLASLRPGLEILARTPAFGGQEFAGEVRSVANQVDQVTRSVLARALVPNPDNLLRPGLLMTVTLLKNPRDALVVPEEALVPRGERQFVLVVHRDRDGEVERRAVEVGARRPGEVEILGGLEPEELVITHGTDRVQPGQRVAIRAVDRGERPISELIRRPADG